MVINSRGSGEKDSIKNRLNLKESWSNVSTQGLGPFLNITSLSIKKRDNIGCLKKKYRVT